MNKTIITIIIAAVVLVGGYFLLRGAYQPSPSVPQSSNQQPNQLPVSEQPSAPSPATENNVVIYTDNGYSPSTLTIKRGETITFKNQSSGSMWTASAIHPTHRLYGGTSLDEHCPDTAGAAFDQCSAGNTYSFTFTKSGTWRYHNHLSPSDTATIIVE